jgi:hypothetical protein
MRDFLKDMVFRLLALSLRASNSERGERELRKSLMKIVPDLSEQYTTYKIETPYQVENLRCVHAFQMGLVLKAIALLDNKRDEGAITIVDIGDSSGTHLKYLKEMEGADGGSSRYRLLSVNLDPVAVQKIRDKGFEAVHCRAEQLVSLGIHANLFLSFAMLEHLFDPISFLHDMASKTECDYFVVTVPYVRTSRVGMQYLRKGDNRDSYAEDTHIFEFSAEDWSLIFRFSGWKIVLSDIYTQYPRFGFLRFTQPIWRRVDFEGFYGVVLQRDTSASEQYKSWAGG